MLKKITTALLICISTNTIPAFAEPTVLCLGDSLTEGYGIDSTQTYPAQLESELKKDGFPQIKVINAGISGATSASGLSRLKWHLKSFGNKKQDTIDVLLLALGANDGLRGLDTQVLKTNLQEIIKLAKTKQISVLLAGMQMPPNYGSEYTKKFAAVFPDVAKQEQVALIPFFLEGVAGQTKLNQADGIHPTAEGYKIITKNILKYIKQILAERKN